MTPAVFLIKAGIMKYQLRISIKTQSVIHIDKDPKIQVTDRSFSGPEYYRAVADTKRKQKVQHALMHVFKEDA